MYPDELESIWDSIYEKRESERQVIFPYIDPKMILSCVDLFRLVILKYTINVENN